MQYTNFPGFLQKGFPDLIQSKMPIRTPLSHTPP